MAKRYRVNIGINYKPHGRGEVERRADPGDVVDDLPTKSVGWLIAQGVVTEEVRHG